MSISLLSHVPIHTAYYRGTCIVLSDTTFVCFRNEMKVRRKKSNLTLGTHKRKKNRDKPYSTLWPNSTKEVLGRLETYHIPKSPSCTIVLPEMTSVNNVHLRQCISCIQREQYKLGR